MFGPKIDWLAGGDGFGRILSAMGSQTLANENDGGLIVPVAQFTGGIDQQGVRIAALELSWARTRYS